MLRPEDCQPVRRTRKEKPINVNAAPLSPPPPPSTKRTYTRKSKQTTVQPVLPSRSPTKRTSTSDVIPRVETSPPPSASDVDLNTFTHNNKTFLKMDNNLFDVETKKFVGIYIPQTDQVLLQASLTKASSSKTSSSKASSTKASSTKASSTKASSSKESLTKTSSRTTPLDILLDNEYVAYNFIPLQNTYGKSFDDFRSFKYFDQHSTVSRIGQPSLNGFINKVEFKRNNMIIYLALKSGTSASKDNIWMDFINGARINNYISIVPCFIQTLSMFQYKNKGVHCMLSCATDIELPLQMNDHLSLVSTATQINSAPISQLNQYVNNSCQTTATQYAVLTQLVKAPISLYSALELSSFTLYDCITSLYQIYYSLALLAGMFTHNDLHGKNIILSQTDPGTCVEFVFSNSSDSSDTYSFRTIYTAKLIDYGRCFVLPATPSASMHNMVCSQPACQTATSKCGKEFGYKFVPKNADIKSDMWLLDLLATSDHKLKSSIKQLVSHLSTTAKDIFDVHTMLKSIVSDSNFTHHTKAPYNDMRVVATIHLYNMPRKSSSDPMPTAFTQMKLEFGD